MPTNRTALGKWKVFRTRAIRNAGPEPGCHWCQSPLDPKAKRGEPGAIELDHLKPVVDYPELEYDTGNVVLSCHPCNRSKGRRDAPAIHRRAGNTSLYGDTYDRNGVRIRDRSIRCKVHSPILSSCPHSGSLIRPPD